MDKPLTYDDFEVDNLIVTVDTSLNDLNVAGKSVVNDLQVTGALTLVNPLTFTQLSATDLTVSAATSLNTLNVSGDVNCSAPMRLTDVSLNNLLIYQNVQVDGFSQLANGAVAGYLNVAGNVGSGSIVVTGQSTLAKTAVDGDLTVNGYTYLGNDASVTPVFPGNTYGAIGGNLTSGQGEMDFISLGYGGSVNSAFNWYMMTSASAKTLLMQLFHTGQLLVNGLLTAAGGVTTTALTATGTTTLAAVNTTGAMNVTGNLHVTGAITSDTSTTLENLEVLFWQVEGNGTAIKAMPLQHNTANDTNYAVFATIYDGYNGGSSGTYDAAGDGTALGQVIISLRTASSFTFTLAHNSTADNVNVYVQFLVVYGVSNSKYPSSYAN